MELTDETWQLVKSQSRVTGILGGKGKPVPITDSEAKRLINQISEGIERPRASIIYEDDETNARLSSLKKRKWHGRVNQKLRKRIYG